MVSGQGHKVAPVAIAFTDQPSPGFFLFGFERNFEFKAGQVIGISLEEDGPRRLYSICSGEEDPLIQVLFNVIEEGYLTPRLSEVEPGDIIWITEPRGEFTCNMEEAVWIATGTGIAPFYSMFRSGLAGGKTLIHGNRYLEQFLFFDDFDSMPAGHYIRCCTGEDDGNVFAGRVTEYLEELPSLNPQLKYYICGSAEMVVDTRDILIMKGVPFDHIISEIYF